MSLAIKTDCLDDVIGLSRTDCECFTVPTNESLSGLYLDELEGLDLKVIGASADCTSGSLWDLMKKAREQAIISFKTDYASNIASNWKQSRFPFAGQIGKDKSTADYTIDNFAGHRYSMLPIKNGVWKIKRIGVYFNATGVINISIYNNIDASPLYTFANVPTVANTLTWFTLPTAVSLPMYDAQKDYVNYFILYANNASKPKDNNFRCCGTILQFNSCPVACTINDQRYNYAQWCNATGVKGASVAAIKDQTTNFSDHAMGLVIDSEMKCDEMGIACNDTDFLHSAIPMVQARAIWYRAGVFLANSILSSQSLNRYTMLDREALYGKRNNYTKEYNERLKWLVNPDVDTVRNYLLNTGCVECLMRMKRGSLL